LVRTHQLPRLRDPRLIIPRLFNDNYSSPLTTIRIPHLG
jgi:hypothetical protein